MSGPIVYVDRSEIVAGQLEALTARIGDLADFVKANEPRILAYAVYIDPDREEISVVHIHRDAASLATHFRIAGPVFKNFVDFVRLQSIDVFGDPSEEVVEELQDKARLLGHATVAVHPFHVGFLRQGLSGRPDARQSAAPDPGP